MDFLVVVNCVQVGIYSLAEAERLTSVRRARIRRWIKGYDFKSKGLTHRSAAVWSKEIEPIDGIIALGFRDLIEIRFVDAFLKAGVSWRTMRLAHQAAQDELGTSHPFCSNRFVTDGRAIFQKQAEEESDAVLINLTNRQQEFARIVGQFLKELEFDSDDSLVRWWPMGRDRKVVVDPQRQFGQPITVQAGVSTQILARSVSANAGEIETVAQWYEVDQQEVRDAVAFELKLAKAA